MNRPTVTSVLAWEALDSRGKPTVAARVMRSDGGVGIAIAPSGASAGSHEARERRDGGARYDGNGVLEAVANVSGGIATALSGCSAAADDIDERLLELDSSPGFAVLGANAILAVSLAAWRAEADAQRTSLARVLQPDGVLELPMPMVNIVSGGAHAGGIIDIQDVLVVPVGASSFAEAIEWAGAVRAAAGRLARERGLVGGALVADEGGLGLPLESNRAALAFVTAAIERAGLEPGAQVSLAVDVAATEFFDGASYRLASENRSLTAAELIDEVAEWTTSFPLVSIEDPVAEDDWDGWIAATRRLSKTVELVGDDLFVTDPGRLAQGIAVGAGTSVLVKVNQNGRVSGARSVVDAARAGGYRTVVSARSGETEESWLADLAVGWRAGQIKVGSTHRSERTAKWNRLLELEALESTRLSPWAVWRTVSA